MRLIDADKLFPYGAVPYVENDGFKTADKLYGIIKNAPTVDAEPVVHGRWERCFNLKPSCSVCGEYHLYSWSDHKNCNYCPNCGAKMNGGNDG